MNEICVCDVVRRRDVIVVVVVRIGVVVRISDVCGYDVVVECCYCGG